MQTGMWLTQQLFCFIVVIWNISSKIIDRVKSSPSKSGFSLKEKGVYMFFWEKNFSPSYVRKSLSQSSKAPDLTEGPLCGPPPPAGSAPPWCAPSGCRRLRWRWTASRWMSGRRHTAGRCKRSHLYVTRLKNMNSDPFCLICELCLLSSKQSSQINNGHIWLSCNCIISTCRYILVNVEV